MSCPEDADNIEAGIEKIIDEVVEIATKKIRWNKKEFAVAISLKSDLHAFWAMGTGNVGFTQPHQEVPPSLNFNEP